MRHFIKGFVLVTLVSLALAACGNLEEMIEEMEEVLEEMEEANSDDGATEEEESSEEVTEADEEEQGEASDNTVETNEEEEEESPACPEGTVAINHADADELQQIEHIDLERAERIIIMREFNPFNVYAGLTRIDGIGPAKANDIEDQGIICFD